MTSARHVPHDGTPRSRTGHEPRRSDAVVRQRLRAVAGGGRPSLAWQPETGAVAAAALAPDAPARLDAVTPAPAPAAAPAATPPPAAAPDVASEARTAALPVLAPSGAGWLPERPDGSRSDDADGSPATSDELGLRARRRAATTVAQAYAAAHGHPTAHSGFEGLDEPPGADGARPRTAVRSRVAVAAAVVVLAVASVTGFVTLRPDPVAALGPVDAAAGAQDPAATVEPAGEDVAPSDAGAGPATEGTNDEAPDAGSDGAEGATDEHTASAPAAGLVVVHVVGQVASPGLVSVVEGARVADALAAAGGTLPDADVAALNLARTVVDGEQVVVPRPGEALPPVGSAPGTVAGAAPAGGAGAAGGVVDLNAADAAALDALPGIGPVLAERIVAWRAEHGRFTSVDELGEVSGIGPSTLDDLRDMVRV